MSLAVDGQSNDKIAQSSGGFSFRDFARRGLNKLNLNTHKSGSLEGADPELAISFLQRGTAHLTSLKSRLSSCSDDWMLSFLDQSGLELIFECLSKLGERGFAKFTDAIDQLTCVGCIRAVMNSKVGLEHIVESTSHVNTLAEGRSDA